MSTPIILSPLERDQADFFGRLNADAFFADIGLYLFRPRANLAATAIVQGIEGALNCFALKGGKGGAAVTVLMPTGDSPDGNVGGPELEERITVRVQELPLTNMGAQGTLKSAESIALEVLRLLHHFRSGGQTWYADNQALTPNLEFAPKVTYDVTFRRKLALSTRAKSTAPLLTPGGDYIVVIQAAAGAAIYYTVDGSYPAPGAAGSTLYSGPVNLLPPATLRAVAYETGKAASNVVQVTVQSVADFSADFFDDFAN
jgi:hypothetical protein